MQIKSVVFDKTGTITHGKPVVTQTKLFVPSNICSLRPFLAIVGTAEGSSEHPIGLAISQNSKQVLESEVLGQCTDFEAVPGHGLQCMVAGVENLSGGEPIDLPPINGASKGTYEVMENYCLHVFCEDACSFKALKLQNFQSIFVSGGSVLSSKSVS